MKLTSEEIRWLIVYNSSNADKIFFNEFMYLMTEPSAEDAKKHKVINMRNRMHKRIMREANDLDGEDSRRTRTPDLS